jgi:hypothetical protein
MHAALGIAALIAALMWARYLLWRRIAPGATGPSKRRVWLVPFRGPFESISRSAKLLFNILDAAHFFMWLCFGLLLLWALVFGPIPPIHEWIR